MPDQTPVVYDNMWTKLGLGGLRGQKWFKAVWRGTRVAFVAGALAILGDLTNIMTIAGIPPELAITITGLAAPALEKLIREYFPQAEF